MTLEWILCEDKEPPKGVFWGFVQGRVETQGYQDSEIRLFINDCNLQDIRTLDFASRYTAIEYNGMSECEHIIAWMPIDKMILPNRNNNLNFEEKMEREGSPGATV